MPSETPPKGFACFPELGNFEATTSDYIERHRNCYHPSGRTSIISKIASSVRRLKPRCRSVTSNDAWLRTCIAALNLRNLIGRGLTRRDGTWLLNI